MVNLNQNVSPKLLTVVYGIFELLNFLNFVATILDAILNIRFGKTTLISPILYCDTLLRILDECSIQHFMGKFYFH